MNNLTQGSQEWLDFRRTKIGASDAPIIMGVSPWSKPLQLWEEKVGIRTEKKLNSAMQRGQLMESDARKAFEKCVGIDTFPEVVTHPDHDWMIASLDGLSMDGKIAVEIKCPGQKSHDIALSGKIPEHYYPQLQHQLAVLGLPFIYYWSFDGSEGVLLTVERDEQYISELIDREIAFFDAMRSKTPPDSSITGYKTTDSWQDAFEQLKDITTREQELVAQIKALSDQREQIKKRLIAEAGGESCIGNGIELSKRYRKGSIRYKDIPELKDVELDQYRSNPTEYWTLRLKDA